MTSTPIIRGSISTRELAAMLPRDGGRTWHKDTVRLWGFPTKGDLRVVSFAAGLRWVWATKDLHAIGLDDCITTAQLAQRMPPNRRGQHPCAATIRGQVAAGKFPVTPITFGPHLFWSVRDLIDAGLVLPAEEAAA